MRKFALPPLSVVALAAAVAAQSSPGTITPLVPFNGVNLGAAVVSTTETPGETVQSLDQLELRSLGGGAYRMTATAEIVGQIDSKLITGTLVLATSPPTWIPGNDVALLNVPGTATDEFQCSISLDGLTCVWDNYQGATYPSATGTTFICHRVATSNQFATTDVRAIAGVPAGGVDPHIGAELPNGNIQLFFLDANGDISKMEVNPLTGASSNQSLAVASGGNAANQTPGTVNFCHSPHVQRDGAGNPRALTFSEYIGSGSDGLWISGINNGGNKYCIAKRDLGGAAYWFANPAVIGGTWAWATATGGYGDPSVFEGNAVANANIGGGGTITAFAPVQKGTMISVVAIGSPAPPYQVPPVQGDILIFPTVGVLDIRFHSVDTGVADWTFVGLPTLGATFTMQVLTLDGPNNAIHAGNTATLTM